jgi:hypothetical protein
MASYHCRDAHIIVHRTTAARPIKHDAAYVQSAGALTNDCNAPARRHDSEEVVYGKGQIP